jgi:hypothetical protein
VAKAAALYQKACDAGDAKGCKILDAYEESFNTREK